MYQTPDIERVGKTSSRNILWNVATSLLEIILKATEWAWEFFTEVLKCQEKAYFWRRRCDLILGEKSWRWPTTVRWKEELLEHGSGQWSCSEIYFDRKIKLWLTWLWVGWLWPLCWSMESFHSLIVTVDITLNEE